MNDFFEILSQFGFPIAVASYLLFRSEKKMESLEQSNREFLEKINDLIDVLNRKRK